MAKVFLSYSHEDEAHRNLLERHLAVLIRQGHIETWHDRRLKAGDSFDTAIFQALEEADIYLLLVSANFLASDYCFSKEMALALRRQNEGKARVIPIILKSCDWRHTELGKLQALPKEGKPIMTWSNYDDAFADVTEQIRRIVEQTSTASALQAQQGVPPLHVVGSATQPRSSNLRVRKQFTEVDLDQFLNSSFEFMVSYFQGSLQELETRNPDIKGQFRKIDANCFTTAIYRGGKKVSECSVCLGGGFSRQSIVYSSNASARGNSYNESLSVEHDDQLIYLRTMGFMESSKGVKLSKDQAADLYWEVLIRPLQ